MKEPQEKTLRLDPAWEKLAHARIRKVTEVHGARPNGDTVTEGLKQAKILISEHEREFAHHNPVSAVNEEFTYFLSEMAVLQFQRANKAEKELERAKSILAAIDAECYEGKSIRSICVLTKPYAKKYQT